MGMACNMHGTDNMCIKMSENMKGRDHARDLSIHGKISKWILEK